MGRIVVVHLTLIFGLMAVGLTDAPSALFGVFVVLKTMYSLSLVLPQWEPATPPVWLAGAPVRSSCSASATATRSGASSGTRLARAMVSLTWSAKSAR